jgi:hypothetical protein
MSPRSPRRYHPQTPSQLQPTFYPAETQVPLTPASPLEQLEFVSRIVNAVSTIQTAASGGSSVSLANVGTMLRTPTNAMIRSASNSILASNPSGGLLKSPSGNLLRSPSGSLLRVTRAGSHHRRMSRAERRCRPDPMSGGSSFTGASTSPPPDHMLPSPHLTSTQPLTVASPAAAPPERSSEAGQLFDADVPPSVPGRKELMAQSAAEALQPDQGWESTFTTDGKEYFWKPSTGEVSWERPAEVVRGLSAARIEEVEPALGSDERAARLLRL